jgi:hypothetical protein
MMTLQDVCYASLPAAALAVLAELRCRPEIRVILVGDRAWVRWEPDGGLVLDRVLPVQGVVLYARRDGRWYQHGRSLPAFDLPADTLGQPLAKVLTPAPVLPLAAPPVWAQPLRLRLVREEQPRPSSGLLCRPAELGTWADTATTAQLTSVRAAWRDGQGLLLGRRLPPIADGIRFWGGRVLVPLGFRLDPALPEGELLALLGVEDSEFVLWKESEAEILSQEAFEPLTRAGIRRALGKDGLHG